MNAGFSLPVFWQVVRTAPARQNPAALHLALAKLDVKLEIAEAQLSRVVHLAGDAFTLADIQFGHVLYRYFDLPITRQERPLLRRYYEALTARSAFREHVMVSYDELRVSD